MPQVPAPTDAKPAKALASKIRARTFLLLLCLLQIILLGSHSLRVAFRNQNSKKDSDLVINPDGHAIIHDEKLAICGYFTLVLAGLVMLVWYAQKKAAPTQKALVFALGILFLVLVATAILGFGSWLIPHALTALITIPLSRRYLA